MTLADRSRAALGRVLSAKPGAVERIGQQQMVEAVSAALDERHHLLVEAGTGTGKSLAYLIPALESGNRTVVATATKALQDQLSESELPFLRSHMDRPVTWAVVKGRQSYACMAKLVERFGPGLDQTPELALFDDRGDAAAQDVAEWARGHHSGDRDDLDAPVSDEVWRELSVSGVECPGAGNCPQGRQCFAEAALERAAGVDVVVTNHHLYGHHLASGGKILPPHQAVVFDEAHKLETAFSSAFGFDIGPGRLGAFAAAAARHIDPVKRRTNDPIPPLRDATDELESVLASLPTDRIDPGEGEFGAVVMRAADAVSAVVRCLRTADEGDPLAGQIARIKNQAGHLIGDFEMALDLPGRYVAWVEQDRRAVRIAPVEVGPSLASSLLVQHPTVLTSATMSVAGSFAPLAARLGFLEQPLRHDPLADGVELPVARTYSRLRVPGAFDYGRQGLLYVASHLPLPSDPRWADAAGDEIEALTAASGGRALVLTTSFAMLRRIADRLAGAPFQVLVQETLPKKRLIAAFVEDETSTLVATMGYWEGIDVPGPSLSLVIIDKLPFARPDDPLTQARREAVERRGGLAFAEVDLPRATTLLAQGAGRLIRNETDRGVVAVLDSRLNSRSYGRRILLSMPRMTRTGDRQRAVRFLEELAAPVE